MFNFFNKAHRFWGSLRLIGVLLISYRFFNSYIGNSNQSSLLPNTLLSIIFFLFFLIIPLFIGIYHGIKGVKSKPVKQKLLLSVEFLFYVFYGTTLIYTGIIRFLFLQHEYRNDLFFDIIISIILGLICFVVLIRIIFEFFTSNKEKKHLKYIDILDSGKEFGQQ